MIAFLYQLIYDFLSNKIPPYLKNRQGGMDCNYPIFLNLV